MPPAAPELSCLQACLRRAGDLRSLLHKVSAATASVNGISLNQLLYVRTDGLLRQIEHDLQELIARPECVNDETRPSAQASDQDSSEYSPAPSEHHGLDEHARRGQEQQETRYDDHDASSQGHQADASAGPVNKPPTVASGDRPNSPAKKVISRPESEDVISQTRSDSEPRPPPVDAHAPTGVSVHSDAADPLSEEHAPGLDFLSSNPLESSLEDAGL